MNERYIFRGKRLDNGEWIFGKTVIHCKNEAAASDNIYMVNEGSTGEWYLGDDFRVKMLLTDFHAVDPATFSQCTGLKDKNGKLIFEGDIIKLVDLDEDFRVIFENERAKFMMRKNGSVSGFEYFYREELKVIGNIHDNPELLGEIQ